MPRRRVERCNEGFQIECHVPYFRNTPYPSHRKQKDEVPCHRFWPVNGAETENFPGAPLRANTGALKFKHFRRGHTGLKRLRPEATTKGTASSLSHRVVRCGTYPFPKILIACLSRFLIMMVSPDLQKADNVTIFVPANHGLQSRDATIILSTSSGNFSLGYPRLVALRYCHGVSVESILKPDFGYISGEVLKFYLMNFAHFLATISSYIKTLRSWILDMYVRTANLK